LKDIFDKCHDFLERPRNFDAADCALAAELFSDVSPPANAGPWMNTNGRALLQFSSNDYLGLANHPDVLAECVAAIGHYGICSPMGSRLMTGTTEHHLELERRISTFKRCEAALAFSAGSLAMIGTLSCLAGPGDMLILDEYAHATLVCGAKVSGARIAYFRHNDLDHLESILDRMSPRCPTAVVVDGVYSMQGDLGRLKDLVELKEHFGFRLIVDDAHGTGVFGQQGRGTAAHFGVEDRIDLHLGTFSKAVGTLGGFVAGDHEVVEYIRFHAPTFVFTKAMPTVVAAATAKALELLAGADQQREKLWKNTRRLQDGLKRFGFRLAPSQSPITPIEFDGTEAIYFAHELRKVYNLWVAPVVYPAVPLGKSILRVIPTANHTDSDIERLIEGLLAIQVTRIHGLITPI